METDKELITVETSIEAPIEKIWMFWNQPEHITQWCAASDDWHAPAAENDLRVDGKFSTTMAAKDGSFSFDFGGVYTDIEENKSIKYTLGDERKVEIYFIDEGESVKITETFEAEETNPVEMQQSGWQAILENFKKYTLMMKDV